MAASPIKILEETRVSVPATAALPREPLRLSALDAQWVTLPLIQRVLIFVDDNDNGTGTGTAVVVPPFASVVAALRASLAETVARFVPLAGRIVHVPPTGDAAIDCRTDGGGVRFAVADGHDDGVDARRLAGDADHDAEAFRRLAPDLDAGALPAEAMAAQVTRLRGGLALGVAMHHAVVDGRSVWRFLQAWAAACRGEADADKDDAPPVTFDRAVIKIPGGGEELARSVLRKYAPDLPKAAVAEFLVRPNLSRRTFTITPQQLHRLKQRLISALPPGAAAPSSFVAVVALSWVSFVRAKHYPAGTISPADEVYLFFFADCRSRMDPPPGDGYFGTCISGCLATATAGDLLLAGDDGLARAADAVAREVRRAAEEPMAGWDWMDAVTARRVVLDRLVNVAGSTRFPAYQATDFGWGQPSRTELVTMNHDGQVVLVAGKDGVGGVQASVSLHPSHMDTYKEHFLSYLLG